MALVTAMMLCTFFVGTASADSTRNYAGRPLSGDTDGSDTPDKVFCNGLAYGKVDGKKVLFFADHCINDAPTGGSIRDEDGVYYGWRPTAPSVQCAGGSSGNDLCYIWLYSGKWPSNPHQVYAGVKCCVYSQWTTIAQPKGSPSWACGTMDDQIGLTVYENHQNLWAGTHYRWEGVVTNTQMGGSGSADDCEIITDLDYSSTYRHSGSPLFSTGNNLVGVATAATGSGKLIFDSVYEGMKDIDAYWDTHGTGVGAWFCTDAACGP